jgi:dipeptidyl-peptidase-4
VTDATAPIDATLPDSYPRQEAATRRFRLGAPRSFTVVPDGSRVVFVRSAGGRDPVGSLWVAEPASDGTLVERCVVDARTLHDPTADLPAAERARRERMRETTAGITGYDTDAAGTRAAFALDGDLYLVDLVDPTAAAVALGTPGPVVDPRLSPDGSTVAFVSDGSLWAVATAPDAQPRLLAEAPDGTSTWGLSDFVAAEELGRSRGHWWLDDSSALLAELVDESPVAVRWIGDPARPEREPVAHRYPAAGTANPLVRLFRIALDGSSIEVEWDREALPYLATVSATSRGTAVVSVLSRDQQRQVILDVKADGSTSLARERTCSPWVTLIPGVPTRTSDGRLLEVVADAGTDTFRLVADAAALTPEALQVTGVVATGSGRVLVTAQPTPLDQHVYAVGDDGGCTALTAGAGVSSVAGSSGGTLIATARPDRLGTTYVAQLPDATGTITSLAELPVVTPSPAFARLSERELATAVLLPTGHVPGSGPLPVVMAPYGGPHHAEVVHAAGSFAGEQWLADQGFAVVVVDGAGTPGRGPAFEYEVFRDFATGVLADQVAGLHAAAAQNPDLDLTRVGITGWSFGGYLAALAVLDRPDVFHAAVAGAPVTDWALYDTAYTERYLGLPQEQPDAYRDSGLLGRADRLTRPLLIVHGLADDNVLAAHTLQLSSALLAAGKPHSVLPLSGVTHMTPQEVVAENLLRLQVAFLREHLRA